MYFLIFASSVHLFSLVFIKLCVTISFCFISLSPPPLSLSLSSSLCLFLSVHLSVYQYIYIYIYIRCLQRVYSVSIFQKRDFCELLTIPNAHTHTYTHIHICMYICVYIYIYVGGGSYYFCSISLGFLSSLILLLHIPHIHSFISSFLNVFFLLRYNLSRFSLPHSLLSFLLSMLIYSFNE